MVQLATICYLDNGRELLMLHRNKKPNDVHAGKWIGVGGKLERGETPQECAAREILEETGLTIRHPKLVGVKNWHTDEGIRYRPSLSSRASSLFRSLLPIWTGTPMSSR